MGHDGGVFDQAFHAAKRFGQGEDLAALEHAPGFAQAAPALGATRGDVLGILPGLQPLAKGSRTAVCDRPLTIDHGRKGGPRGLISVSGVKYTTARHVAQQVVAGLPDPADC